MKPVLGTLFGILCGLLFVACSAYGHEHHNANGTSQDYTKWMRPGTNISCCNHKDCLPVAHRFVGGRLQFLLFNEWVFIPEAAILHEAIVTDRNAHWCGQRTLMGLAHYCAAYPKGEVSLPQRLYVAYAY